ncbi:MAG TPA: hypothetical protein VH333_15005 [Pseudonocardiaceae bacterium]|jgi:hypothetical protein|nr:hypothetical protein [Pseudonocardiaceae bacterium]
MVRHARSARHRGGAVAFAAIAVVCLVAACSNDPTKAAATPPRPQVGTAHDPLANASFTPPLTPAGAVLTQRGDDTRLGWDSTETALTVHTVGSTEFGKRTAYPVDGKVYAQPLYVPGLTVNGGRHDVVIVATQHDTVYAFDADARGATPPAPLWRMSLLQPGARTFLAARDRIAANRLCDSITPEVGISSTPVIDWTTRSLYVVALDVEHGALTYRLHRLDLLTGKDIGRPVTMAATVTGDGLDAVSGQVSFRATEAQQRVGLTLVNGVVYAAFSSWCGLNPYHGWVLGYRTADLARVVVYNSTPNANDGGLWESMSGLNVDSHGHLILVTGNGPFNLTSGGTEAGDSLLEMTPMAGTLKIVDSFTPFDQECRYEHDQDLGSGSPLMVPGHDEMILSSKTGAVYVLDQSHLGGYTPLAAACKHQTRTDVDHVKQELAVDSVPGGMWGTWGYWKSAEGEFVYGSGIGARPTEWRLNADGTIATPPVAQGPEAFDFPGAIPVVSSNGSTPGTGIVWMVDQHDGAVVRAFDATDISHEIWNSAGNPARDGMDTTSDFNHFGVPTVAGGKVFVGDRSHLEIYGLLDP